MFDLDDFEEVAPYGGPAPLSFTADYYTPAELLAARAHLSRVLGNGWPRRAPNHTWGLAITLGWCGHAPGHSLCVLTADLRCACRFPYTWAEWDEIGPCYCVGDLLYQANCEECRWHTIGSERAVVEAWHDHAWPGWRDLPVVPFELCDRTGGMDPARALDKKGAAKARAWVIEHYPAEWQVSGAPVRTEREPVGSRHVPGYSPWGGFDMGVVREVTA